MNNFVNTISKLMIFDIYQKKKFFLERENKAFMKSTNKVWVFFKSRHNYY